MEATTIDARQDNHEPRPAGDDSPWLLIDDLPCLGCGFNLRGQRGPVVRCPQCGRDNNLADPAPWAPASIRSRLRFGLLGTVMASLIGAPSAVWMAVGASSGGARIARPAMTETATMPVAAVMTFAVAMTVVWLFCCRGWVQRCHRKPVGWVMLLVGHLSVWALLGGLGGSTASGMGLRAILYGTMMAAALVGIWWVVRTVDREAVFVARYRWNWDLPLNRPGPA